MANPLLMAPMDRNCSEAIELSNDSPTAVLSSFLRETDESQQTLNAFLFQQQTNDIVDILQLKRLLTTPLVVGSPSFDRPLPVRGNTLLTLLLST